MDKLTALRIFRRVNELGSFAAAARDLDLSNAAVSKNIRELEDHLGVRLINRTTRRLHLTEAGAGYLNRVSAILEDLGNADTAAASEASGLRGRLKVAAPMSVGLAKVAPAIAAFLVDHPGMAVDLELDDRPADIIGDGYDVAIRGAGRLKDSSLVARLLTRLDRTACASPDYLRARGEPRTPAALAGHDCLIYSLSASPDRWIFRRGKEVQAAAIGGRLRINNSLALAAAAAAGLGIALVPRFAVAAELARGALVEILDGWRCEPISIYAIYPKQRHESLKVRRFIEHMAQALT
jgi:DNA-binding transcriptional LysR family regulator